jgi:hypothetical protein
VCMLELFALGFIVGVVDVVLLIELLGRCERRLFCLLGLV